MTHLNRATMGRAQFLLQIIVSLLLGQNYFVELFSTDSSKFFPNVGRST